MTYSDEPCSTCKHPKVQHTGRSIWPSKDGRLPESRLGPVLPRWDGGCETLTDWHHTCPCAEYARLAQDRSPEPKEPSDD